MRVAMHTHVARVLLLASFAACSSSPLVPTPGAEGFDGALAGWTAASTGGSGPHASWSARADAAAISKPNVVAMTRQNHGAEDRFNLYWTPLGAVGPVQDGRIAVAVRADSGKVDQGGGPMWRVQDADNYYLCRYNPLESNFRVYVVKEGVRRQLATALVEGKVGDWHRIEASFAGDRITCSFDGEVLLQATDATIQAGGGHGLWTKADACTSFDDLVVAKQ
jgi:hypothetical protein